MHSSGHLPLLLVAVLLGIVVYLKMRERNEVVGIAVNEEHRQYALGHLSRRRSLPETPAILFLSNKTRTLKHIRRNKPEALLTVGVELLDHGSITAVLDKALDIIGQRVATGHHDRSAAHRDAVKNHKAVVEQLVGDRDPLLNVQTVKPPHLNLVTLRIAVILQVREEHVVVELVPVHTHQIQEYIVIVAISVDNDGRSFSLLGPCGGHIAGMQLLAVPAGRPGVLENTLGLEAVIPCRTARHQGIRLVAGAFDIGHAVRFRPEGKTAHEFACNTGAEGQRCEAYQSDMK